jgi:hypothetical protein
MRLLRALVFLVLVFAMFGCGGGGGGGPTGGVRLTGRVLDIVTGGTLNPGPSVQSLSETVNASVVDGSFSLRAPTNATSLVVNPVGYPVFTFTFPPATTATTDVGDLWVGPQTVIVTGLVRDAASGNAVSNAQVSFGGQNAVTDSSGQFALANVAYSATSPAGFLGLTGNVAATGFFPNQFTSNGNLATAGQVFVGEILLTPLSDPTPPGLPFNVWGRITPQAQASGTIVSVFDSTNTLVRRYTVGSDSRYQFWLNPGSYRLEFAKGALTSPAQNTTLTTASQVNRLDANLN